MVRIAVTGSFGDQPLRLQSSLSQGNEKANEGCRATPRGLSPRLHPPVSEKIPRGLSLEACARTWKWKIKTRWLTRIRVTANEKGNDESED